MHESDIGFFAPEYQKILGKEKSYLLEEKGGVCLCALWPLRPELTLVSVAGL